MFVVAECGENNAVVVFSKIYLNKVFTLLMHKLSYIAFIKISIQIFVTVSGLICKLQSF